MFFATIKKEWQATALTTNKKLRSFNLILLALLLALTWLNRRHGRLWVWYSVDLLLFICLISPKIIKPLYRVWMGVALIIGFWVNRLLLLAVYYIILTPIALILRLLGKNLLNERIDKNLPSYWIKTPDINATIKKNTYSKMYSNI